MASVASTRNDWLRDDVSSSSRPYGTRPLCRDRVSPLRPPEGNEI
jgi:hypothetical protein